MFYEKENEKPFFFKVCNFLNHTLETIPQATKSTILHIHQRKILKALHLKLFFNILCMTL